MIRVRKEGLLLTSDLPATKVIISAASPDLTLVMIADRCDGQSYVINNLKVSSERCYFCKKYNNLHSCVNLIHTCRQESKSLPCSKSQDSRTVVISAVTNRGGGRCLNCDQKFVCNSCIYLFLLYTSAPHTPAGFYMLLTCPVIHTGNQYTHSEAVCAHTTFPFSNRVRFSDVLKRQTEINISHEVNI